MGVSLQTLRCIMYLQIVAISATNKYADRVYLFHFFPVQIRKITKPVCLAPIRRFISFIVLVMACPFSYVVRSSVLDFSCALMTCIFGSRQSPFQRYSRARARSSAWWYFSHPNDNSGGTNFEMMIFCHRVLQPGAASQRSCQLKVLFQKLQR